MIKIRKVLKIIYIPVYISKSYVFNLESNAFQRLPKVFLCPDLLYQKQASHTHANFLVFFLFFFFQVIL